MRCARRRRHGVLLVFDEVMTSRLSMAGCSSARDRPRPDDPREVRRRRPLVRRLRRPRRPDGPLRPVASGRAPARRHVQQRRAHDGRGRRRPDAGADGSRDRAPQRSRRPPARPPERVRVGTRHRLLRHRPRLARRTPLHARTGPHRGATCPRRPSSAALLHLHMLERGFSYGRRGFIALSLPLGERRSTASRRPSRSSSPASNPYRDQGTRRAPVIAPMARPVVTRPPVS